MPKPPAPVADPLALAEALLQQIGEFRFVAHGASMIPAIYPGDEIVVRRAILTDIRPGDVVLFRRDDRWFLHRVRQIERSAQSSHVVTQGDALPSPDAPICQEQLLGRAAFLIDNGQPAPFVSERSLFHRALQVAVRHIPFAVGVCLRCRCLFARGIALHREFATSLVGKPQGAA